MPGIAGIVDASRAWDITGRLRRMMARMRHEPWYATDELVQGEDGVGLAQVNLPWMTGCSRIAHDEVSGTSLALHGELYDADDATGELRNVGRQVDANSHAQLMLEGYLHCGQAFYRGRHGSFVAAIWDGRTSQLMLVNDAFGARPLYWAHAGEQFLFASSLRSIVEAGDLLSCPDWRGIASFFSFGQYFGNDTSQADIKALYPSAWLTYDARKNRVVSGTYEAASEVTVSTSRSESDHLERIDVVLATAVTRRLGGTGKLGLALSGGLDARTILAAIDHDRHDVHTVSYGVAGSLDHRCAQQMANIVGCRHTSHLLDRRFLDDFPRHLARMVRLTDGQYLSQCIILPTLPVYRDLGIEVLLRGHAGELMHMHKAYAWSVDREALAVQTGEQLRVWLLRHLQAHMLSGLSGNLFREIDNPALSKLAEESLDSCLAELEHVQPPPQRIWHLFVRQRLHRETASSLAKFGSMVEPRVPFLDRDLVDLLLALPPEVKVGERIQSFILKKRRPKFLDIVNANTGARVGAGEWSRRLHTFRLRGMAKLRVPGYQPYERLGLWLRRELQPLVHDILLGEACLEGGPFEPDTVRRVVREHETKRHNHTYLIMAMMIFELGQRYLAGALDGDALRDAGERQSAAAVGSAGPR